MKYLFKTTLLFTLSLLFVSRLGAQVTNPNKSNIIKIKTTGSSKISTSTGYLLSKAKYNKSKNNKNAELDSNIRIMLKFKEGCTTTFKNNIFKDLYIVSNTIATAFIKISDLPLLENIDCLIYADVGEKMESEVLNARMKTNVDPVHSGTQLNQQYKGNGVIVGIIDIGFDYTHPNFKDANGNLRISRVWETNNTSGTPPIALGVGYGSEYVGETDILDKQFDVNTKSHGTHVAGIAVGTGNTSDLTGMAPESEIVLVSGLDVMGGMIYLRNYAESVNKPLVVNMSFGSNLGPHDGSTLEDSFLADLSTQEGLVVIKSAGNDGGSKKHVLMDFNSEENKFILNDNNSSTSRISIWAGNQVENSSFGVTIGVYDTDSGTYDSNVLQLLVEGSYQGTHELIDNDLFDTDIWNITLISEINPLNNRPHLKIITDASDNGVFSDDYIVVTVTSIDDTVHSWCNDCEFTSLDGYNFEEGDGYYSVTSPGNSNGVITVGNYNSTDDYGVIVDDLNSSSSKGPRIDNVLKPDITAPGYRVTSSVNSFDPTYQEGGEFYSDVLQPTFGGYSYAKMQGTSMAAPVVTGIVALWLEANPNLSTNQVMTIMHDTAIIDSYTETGFFGPTPNYEWGYGKVDALAGLQQIETSLTIEDTINSIVKLYPNPTSGILNVDFRGAQVDEVVINNLVGQKILQENLNTSQISKIDLTGFEIGIYILSLKNKGQTVLTTKILKSE